MSHLIRKYNKGDLDDLVHIKLVAQQVSMPYKKSIRSFADEKIYMEDTSIRCEIWVAIDKEKIIGFCAVGSGWVEQMFVDPQYFRNGAGSALINKATESNTHLKLLVDFKNTDAILFYESQGFIQSGAIENADAFEYQWSP